MFGTPKTAPAVTGRRNGGSAPGARGRISLAGGIGTAGRAAPAWLRRSAHSRGSPAVIATSSTYTCEKPPHQFLVRTPVPHVITTSYLTHDAIAVMGRSRTLRRRRLFLSPGRSVGLRLVPMARDLKFAWEETPQQLLDEQKQKVRGVCTQR